MPFHAEIRQGRNVARGFNLTEEDVRARFLRPLQAGSLFVLEGREWEPRKTNLTVIEGAVLHPGQLTLGQGWTNAVKRGTDVTERFVKRATPESGGPDVLPRLKERIVGRLGAGPLELSDSLALTADLLPGHRVSQRLDAVETAVWELLHAGGRGLRSAGAEVDQDAWQELLLAPETWLGTGPPVTLI